MTHKKPEKKEINCVFTDIGGQKLAANEMHDKWQAYHEQEIKKEREKRLSVEDIEDSIKKWNGHNTYDPEISNYIDEFHGDIAKAIHEAQERRDNGIQGA